MLKIIIQNPSSETIINNVCPEELSFWRTLLEGAVRGEIKVFDVETGKEYQEYQDLYPEAYSADTYEEGYQVA